VNEVTTELYKNVSSPSADQQTGEDKQGGEQKSESTSEQGTTKENSSN